MSRFRLELGVDSLLSDSDLRSVSVKQTAHCAYLPSPPCTLRSRYCEFRIRRYTSGLMNTPATGLQQQVDRHLGVAQSIQLFQTEHRLSRTDLQVRKSLVSSTDQALS